MGQNNNTCPTYVIDFLKWKIQHDGLISETDVSQERSCRLGNHHHGSQEVVDGLMEIGIHIGKADALSRWGDGCEWPSPCSQGLSLNTSKQAEKAGGQRARSFLMLGCVFSVQRLW